MSQLIKLEDINNGSTGIRVLSDGELKYIFGSKVAKTFNHKDELLHFIYNSQVYTHEDHVLRWTFVYGLVVSADKNGLVVLMEGKKVSGEALVSCTNQKSLIEKIASEVSNSLLLEQRDHKELMEKHLKTFLEFPLILKIKNLDKV